MQLRINAERLLNDIQSLGLIGATPEGGVTRPAMSEVDLAGRAWFQARAEHEGFTFRHDGAGNLSAVLAAQEGDAKTLLLGSHLDTVPNGGRYDGALGVLSALEVLRTIRDAGITLPFHLEAISFTDEEGSVLGLLGSSALAGQLTLEYLHESRGGSEKMREGMARLGISYETILGAERDPNTLVGYLEVHPEQGKRLEQGKYDIGVVTSIVGIRSLWIGFEGEAAHAGTQPMDERHDALWGASTFVLRARQMVMERFTPGVMNCGKLDISPSAFNIVPGRVELALEFRHGTDDMLDEMEDVLRALAHEVAETFGLRVAIVQAGRYEPALMDGGFIQAIEAASDEVGLSHIQLMSFAGHDGASTSKMIPSAMFFVPSVDGISHNPKEYTHDQDVVNGANVLLHSVLKLAGL